jgi:RNAse (barnase) inhibitor barstar
MPNFQHNISTNNTFLAFLDGSKCTTMNDVYDNISKALQFPDYFGYNLDALDEAICDLDWIEEKTILLLIFNYDSFLSKEKDKLEIMNAIFSHAISELESNGVYFSVLTQQL